uniref:B3 domain-containing protein At1g49475 family n=1 Tax=Cajanus cajan TaxID=3821 RepID=A0A151RGH5_CAJCA|nr:B3 domain-containing protein At1g49475 family [Cajanus cajan]
MIPRSFVKRYGEELLNPVMLKLPNGAKWEVHWTKCDHDDIYFEKGWENFAKHYSLSNGHFLVFRYEGGSQFQVLIFDGSALEIDYPTSNSSTHHAEGTNTSHEDVEEIDDDSPLPRKQKANPGNFF